MSLRHPSTSVLDLLAPGSQMTTPPAESATPSAALHLAMDRQRVLLQSLRHYHPPPHTVSAPAAAATTLLDPSAFCLPAAVSIICSHRAFPVTAARAWNALPSSVRSAPSLLQFRRDLKTALFQSSYSSP